MTEDQINKAAGDYIELACQQFKDEKKLLQFVSATAALSLSVMESLSSKEYLDQFVADATGPGRMMADVELERVQ